MSSGEGRSSPISYSSYERLADYYRDFVDTKSFHQYYERPALTALIPDVAEREVLDAGCAAGWYTQWLIERGARVTAVDFSPGMLQATRQRVGESARIVRHDLNQPLDFIQSESIDFIVSSLTLHYIEDWRSLFLEFQRVLRPNGKFVFSVPHPFLDFAYFKRENYFATELLTDSWGYAGKEVEIQFYRRPLSEITAPLLAAGFTLERLEEPLPEPAFAQTDPENYDRLTKHPHFLFIRAAKNG